MDQGPAKKSKGRTRCGQAELAGFGLKPTPNRKKGWLEKERRGKWIPRLFALFAGRSKMVIC
jgi:hypothetical protein